MLRFVSGRAASGKTYTVLEMIADAVKSGEKTSNLRALRGKFGKRLTYKQNNYIIFVRLNYFKISEV